MTNNISSLINPEILKNLKSSNLPKTFGQQIAKSEEQKIISGIGNSTLASLLQEKANLIEEEIQLTLEYQKQTIPESKNLPTSSYTTEKIANYLITTPTNIVDKSIAILFGGCCWASVEKMKSYIPKSILNSKRVIIVDQTMNNTFISYEQAIAFVKEKFPKEKINSVSGFSKGGKQAWIAASSEEIGKYNYINLIDPEMYSNESKYAKQDPKILMIYNPEVWTSCCPNVKRIQTETGPKMKNSAVKVNLPHEEIPTYFFNKYSNRF